MTRWPIIRVSPSGDSHAMQAKKCSPNGLRHRLNMRWPSILCASVLAMTTLLAPVDASAQPSQLCADLWKQRNAIFFGREYCFGSKLGQHLFSNDGCTTKNAALSAAEQTQVKQIQQQERANGCKVDSSEPTLLDSLSHPEITMPVERQVIDEMQRELRSTGAYNGYCLNFPLAARDSTNLMVSRCRAQAFALSSSSGQLVSCGSDCTRPDLFGFLSETGDMTIIQSNASTAFSGRGFINGQHHAAWPLPDANGNNTYPCVMNLDAMSIYCHSKVLFTADHIGPRLFTALANRPEFQSLTDIVATQGLNATAYSSTRWSAEQGRQDATRTVRPRTVIQPGQRSLTTNDPAVADNAPNTSNTTDLEDPAKPEGGRLRRFNRRDP